MEVPAASLLMPPTLAAASYKTFWVENDLVRRRIDWRKGRGWCIDTICLSRSVHANGFGLFDHVVVHFF